MNLDPRELQLGAMTSVIQEIKRSNPERVLEVIGAVHFLSTGVRELSPSDAIKRLQELLQDLSDVREAEIIRSMIHLGLIEQFAMTGQYEQAIRHGYLALPVLARDSARFPLSYASALHDLGGALAYHGDTEAGLESMRRALSIYEDLSVRLPEEELTRRNIRAIESRRLDKPRLWRRRR